MANKPLYKSGEDNHRPGEYLEADPRGGAVGDPRQVPFLLETACHLLARVGIDGCL